MITSNPIETTVQQTGILHTNTQFEKNYYDLGALYDMSAGNKDFIVSLVKIFLDTIPVNSQEMVEACAAGNWDMVSKLAHKLKSTVDMMRMTSITQDIRTIEHDAKNQVNKEILPVFVEKVHLVIQASAKQLQQEFNLD